MKSPFDCDSTVKEVDAPIDNWCTSGHTASETFKRNGSTSLAEPTRFFWVQAESICGIYCEPCLIIANHISKMKKQGKM